MTRTPAPGECRAWSGVLVSLIVSLVLQACGAGDSAAQTPRRGAPSPKRPQRIESEHGLRHVVRSGDTLYSIARRHGVDVQALVRANHLSERHHLRLGERLVIPLNVAPPDRQEPPSPAEIVLGPPPDAGEIGFGWPLVQPVLVSPFGARGRSWHGGVDLRAEIGTPVRAAASGLVIATGWEGSYGRVVKIWHHLDFMTVYAHNHENLVRVGDWVEQGQLIATVGNTGRSTAPHLHFESRHQGRKYDPFFWLPPAGSTEVVSTMPRSREIGR